MKKKWKGPLKDFQTVSLLFFLVSCFGWVFETAVCFYQSGEYCDRGFLSLPFCPIYGAPVCLIYYLFSRPSDGRFFHWLTSGGEKPNFRTLKKLFSVVLYFFFAATIATLAELAVGLILESAGLSLWSYNGTPFCFMGVVCLPVSLAWGGLISFFAQFILPPVERWLYKIPKKWKQWLNAILWTALLADFIYNVGYYFSKGEHLEFD